MANAKELRKRIKGVSSTRKITRTMQLVATAKAKGAQDRVKAVVPYGNTLLSMVSRLVAAGARHPLLAGGRGEGADEQNVVIFAITANRGLCGGYNSNVVKMARDARQAELDAGRTAELYMSGKKGVSTARFLGLPTVGNYKQFDDRPSFADVSAVGQPLIDAFLAGDIDRVDAVSYRFISAGQQIPKQVTLLPITPPPLAETGVQVEPLLHPDPQSLLGELLPLVAQTGLFQAYVEAAVSEQIQRRIAMKNATDAADEMVGNLTQIYNRARQAGITQEIAEIVGGAAALE